MENNKQIILIVAIIVLAIVIAVRIYFTGLAFSHVVDQSKKSYEGTDVQLVRMVNRLEEQLAIRAAFGFSGGKDPMTGKTRRVVTPVYVPKKNTPKKVTQKKTVDPVKITAIIYDDSQNVHTAIVMDGERSFSVEVGDRVKDRKITRITAKVVYMESSTHLFKYDIYGKKIILPKGALFSN